MSWESTVSYYRIINEEVRRILGEFHSAEIILYSVDFQAIEQLQRTGRWEETADILASAAAALERAGADFLVLCTNTMHRVAPQVEEAVRMPLLHIADATAGRVLERGFVRAGLLGTRFTMQQDFYKGRLNEKHGLSVITPGSRDQQTVHDVIYDELCRGVVRTESRAEYRRILRALADEGAQCVILGCTEISLLVHPEDCPVPLFDTAEIHAKQAAAAALEVELPGSAEAGAGQAGIQRASKTTDSLRPPDQR